MIKVHVFSFKRRFMLTIVQYLYSPLVRKIDSGSSVWISFCMNGADRPAIGCHLDFPIA